MSLPGLVAWLAALLICASVRAQSAPFELGVGTHVGLGKTDAEPFLRWARESGISSLRDEVLWSDVERSPGVYTLSGRALSSVEALRKARAAGLRPLVIVGYGNPLYDGGGQPCSAAGRAAFAAYASWLARTLGSDASYFEIWNEWNLGAGSRPRVKSGDPAAYVALLAEASRAIKAVRPEAVILAGGMGGDADGWPWLREAIAAGMLRHADGVSVHLYNHGGPRAGGGVGEFMARLGALRALLAESGGSHSPPIYVTESGWPDHAGPDRVEPAAAAARALRFVLELRGMPEVRGLWLYEFSDGGVDPAESEQHFGLFSHDYREKPSACRLRSTAAWLPGATRVQAFAIDGVRVERLATRAGDQVLAVWLDGPSTCAAREVVLEGRGLSLRPFQPSCGADFGAALVAQSSRELRLRATDSPLLFWLPRRAVLARVSASEGLVSRVSAALCQLPPLRRLLTQ